MTIKNYEPLTATVKTKGRTYELTAGTQSNTCLIVKDNPNYNPHYHNSQPKAYYEIVTNGPSREQENYEPWNLAQAADLAAVDKYFLGRRMTYKDDPLAAYEGIITTSVNYYPEKVLIEAARLLINNHNARLEHAEKCREHPLYKALEPIAQAHIKNYYTDFAYHDARILAQDPTAVLWQVDSYGTWMTTDLAGLNRQIQNRTKKHAYMVGYTPQWPDEPIKIMEITTEAQWKQALNLIEQKHQQRQARQAAKAEN